MKKIKIFPKMFIQIFSVLAIIIILVHSLVYFIFPKTYLETRKEKIHNIANEISSNMNGKEIKYIEQTLELYSKSSEIKAFIKEKNNKNEIQIKDDINVNLESDSNSLIIEEREITLNDGEKINLQFVSTADMQKDAKDLSIKFLPYSLLISRSSPNLCVNSSFSYVVLSTLLLSSRDLTEWSLVYHSTLSYQRFYDLHSIHYDHLEGLHQLI